MENQLICRHCNNSVENLVTVNIDGQNQEEWCEDCVDSEALTCDECGRLYHEDWIGDTQNGTYCIDCIDEGNTCDHCGDFIPCEQNTQRVIVDGSEEYWCESCYRDHSAVCENCDEVFSLETGDVQYYEHLGQDLCYHCYSEECNSEQDLNIMGYNEEHCVAFTPKTLDGESNCNEYVGTELEVETNGITSKDTHYITDNLPVVLAYDGSLSCNGYEIITQPMSWKYFESMQPTFKKVFDTLISRGYKSHDTRSCGLHIHVTRPSEEVIDRILFIMETYKEELIKFSRRDIGSLNDWARFLSDYTSEKRKLSSLDFIKQLKNENVTRYQALNVTNTKTIEFRLFRGTLNSDTYFASVELVHNLVEACSDLSKPLSEITWEYITRSKYANAYVTSRGIFSNKIPKDMTNELLRMYRQEQLEKNKIIRVMLTQLDDEIAKLPSIKRPNINADMTVDEIKRLFDNFAEKKQSYASKYANISREINLYIYKILNSDSRDSYIQVTKMFMNEFNVKAKTKEKFNNIINCKGGEA